LISRKQSDVRYRYQISYSSNVYFAIVFRALKRRFFNAGCNEQVLYFQNWSALFSKTTRRICAKFFSGFRIKHLLITTVLKCTAPVL